MKTTAQAAPEAEATQTDRVLLEHMLRAAGLDPATIEPWLPIEPILDISGHAGDVVNWISSFSPNEDQAILWYRSRHDLRDSLVFSANGWTPKQADRLLDEIYLLVLRSASSSDSDLRDWANSGMPPEFAIACVEKNIASHHDALDLYRAATAK